MNNGYHILKRIICSALLGVFICLQTPVLARDVSGINEPDQTQRYIVILDDPPLASYDGRPLPTPERSVSSTSLRATANEFTGASKLDVESPASQQYLHFLDERLRSFQSEATRSLGRELKPLHRYRNALNGFATELSPAEVEVLRNMPRVRSVSVDEVLHLQTDSGPGWIGALSVHEGSSGFGRQQQAQW